MKRGIYYLLFSISVLALWQFLGNISPETRLLLSTPGAIISYLHINAATLIHDTLVTFTEAASGLAIAVIFSFSMMVVCLIKPGIMKLLLPVMVTTQVIPVIVLAPFFIILFGLGLSSKIAMAAVISFFPIFVNFAQGYKAIDQNIHEFFFIQNASLSYRIRRVYFPLAAPSIFSGLKVSATLAAIGAIVAEFTGSESGLGRNLFLSAIRLEPELMMCSLFLSALIGMSLFGLFNLLERRLGGWYL